MSDPAAIERFSGCLQIRSRRLDGGPQAGTPGTGFDFQGAAVQAREYRERLAAEMMAVLTPEQKMKWEAVQGSQASTSGTTRRCRSIQWKH
jgi:hypothetical protein